MKHDFNQSYYLDQLSQFHRLFYAVFELGQPSHTKSISTAAVGLNTTTGKIHFLINPDFFYKLGQFEQLFIICHEAMHVLLSHIDRSMQYDLDPKLSNIAQDIVINETLVTEFGFHREILDFGCNLCFIDTVFNQEQIDKHQILSGKSFEFYYDLLVKYQKEISKDVVLLDFHLSGNGDLILKDEEGNVISEIPSEIAEHIANKIGHQLGVDELEDLLESLKESYQKAGKGAMGTSLSIQLDERKKRPWQKLIKNKIATLQKTLEKRQETFKFRPRRIINLPENLHLPETRIEDIKENDKFNIVFFLDSSGSCMNYRSKFFNLVRTIPQDKFNVMLYSFDSKTYLLNINQNTVKGGGGTDFEPLEITIQDLKSHEKRFRKKYPDLVFVLSDGDGTDVYPEKPDRWYFLLTKNSTGNVPSGANIILISDFTKNDPKVTVKNLTAIDNHK